MTGRKGRVVRDSRGHGMYELRAKPDSSEMDSLNVKEAGVVLLALAPFYTSWAALCAPTTRLHEGLTFSQMACFL